MNHSINLFDTIVIAYGFTMETKIIYLFPIFHLFYDNYFDRIEENDKKRSRFKHCIHESITSSPRVSYCLYTLEPVIDLKNKQANNPNKIYRLYLEYYSYLQFCHNKIAIFLSFEIESVTIFTWRRSQKANIFILHFSNDGGYGIISQLLDNHYNYYRNNLLTIAKF
ncbi:hypothetical protein DERP_000340 [Dermatophagoides pteronyssinus]|uniref:Uncharacterized protein n=1 Tax=Dermatophagoides pteronyssinus TaxID=6956 RepID=A0ABQ8IZU8_DERPT|nr:hypothetical protein DERP_000340 [Dermatophagoides pteronyssinus]